MLLPFTYGFVLSSEGGCHENSGVSQNRGSLEVVSIPLVAIYYEVNLKRFPPKKQKTMANSNRKHIKVVGVTFMSGAVTVAKRAVFLCRWNLLGNPLGKRTASFR